jgi:hypothetical protein
MRDIKYQDIYLDAAGIVDERNTSCSQAIKTATRRLGYRYWDFEAHAWLVWWMGPVDLNYAGDKLTRVIALLFMHQIAKEK